MIYYVYLIQTVKGYFNKSYVGYTTNLKNRLLAHNSNKGAKSTKGYKWQIIFKRKFFLKQKALSFEYKLKKDRKERLRIINEFKKKKS
jgi:putative endonuclease